jgi:hypothetical protein
MKSTAQDLMDAYDSGLYNYDPGETYTFRGTGGEQNTIKLFCGGDEMLKFSDKGFWVRGVKIQQDDKEAEHVYNAFKQWLVWAQLTGQV